MTGGRRNTYDVLNDLARICILADCTLILAWSFEETARYLETYKMYENKPADILKEKVEQDYISKVTDCLTTVKSVNRTDCITLISTFKHHSYRLEVFKQLFRNLSFETEHQNKREEK
ncbi:DNA excision repair protein ERCC-1 isoform X1 [Leucoraja erinacea]|uniref:DNA excision repair protein ERCC-1 isoform X1 n=1 Tax=Leucoraja erinaceus TaxID=7782 RepID=UPI0024572209|nr:DNA excision repair protein ERCC-1 isoform X1 [Leucoraja erinacea]